MRKKIKTFETTLEMMFRCRIEEFSSIVPDQPKLSTNSTGEVFLQFFSDQKILKLSYAIQGDPKNCEI